METRSYGTPAKFRKTSPFTQNWFIEAGSADTKQETM